MTPQLQSAMGLIAMIVFAWVLSANRRLFPWRVVILGLVLQLSFAVLILRTDIGEAFFDAAKQGFVAVIDSVDVGAEFVFGKEFKEHFFAFKVLSSIVFISALMSLLYYLRILQAIVHGMAWLMRWTLGTSGAESLSSAANVFAGHTEAPLVVKPYLNRMTRSEMMAVMTGGMATVSGGVMAAYVEFGGADPGHLLMASVISAPAALLIAKVMQPETETPETLHGAAVDTLDAARERPANALDAIARGAGDGLKLALNVGAMVIAFLAMIALVNLILGALGNQFGRFWSLEEAVAPIFRPFAWLMGISWEDSHTVGRMLGVKTVANEIIAYEGLKTASGEISQRSHIITQYALCGFANFGSIGVQIGGLGVLAPDRRTQIAQMGLRAMVAGTLGAFMTACVAGMLIDV